MASVVVGLSGMAEEATDRMDEDREEETGLECDR